MRITCCVLLGISTLIQGLFGAQDVGSGNHTQRNLPVISSPNQKQFFPTKTAAAFDNTLIREAEAVATKAESLATSQTRRNLTAAALLFQKSASLFKTGHAPSRAAEAYLSIGGIHFVFS